MVPIVKTNSSTLSEGGTVWLVCTLHILAGVSLEAGVISLMRRIPKACRWKLAIFARGYAASDREGLPQILAFLSTMIGMAKTGLDQGLPPASLSCMIKITIISTKIRAHLTKV